MQHTIRRILLGLLILLLVAGCGAHRLRQAQDAFNGAARLEAQSTIENEDVAGDPLLEIPQALNQYRIALALTEEALTEYGGQLQSDKLLGTALMLKALCLWRIGALDENADKSAVAKIVADIENRAKESSIVLGTRDRVLLHALPGLREHALGLQAKDPERAAAFFESAIETLETSLTGDVPADHPVRIYIRLAQMKSLRAWRWVEYPNRPTDPTELRNWLQGWLRRYEGFREKLEPFMEANRGLKQRVNEMDEVIGRQTMRP